MSAPTCDHPCFDFVLRSTIALPELAEGARPNADVVTVTRGSVPATEGEVHVAGDATTLTVPGIARYRVRGGAEIVVDPAPDASDRMVRLFLLGSALGILGFQRGMLLLHANAVVIDGAAHAFAGPSGAGKSTLAAHFERAGHPILCDDVCGVTFAADGTPLAWPGLPRLKLWGDAVGALGYDAASFDRVVDGHDKYQVPFGSTMPAAPVPLRALYLLDRAAPGESGGIARLRGGAAMAAVLENSYRAGYLEPMGLMARHFGHVTALINRTAVHRVTRAWGFDVYAREVARIERHMREMA